MSEIVRGWREQRPDLDPSPLLVFGRIARIGQVADTTLRAPFAEEGLAPGDFDVLAALRRLGTPFRCRPVELSRRLLVTTGAITKRLDRLEAQGLLRRVLAEEDGRGKHVQLTPRGRRLVDRLLPLHLANERRLLAGLTATERRQLAGLLGKLALALES